MFNETVEGRIDWIVTRTDWWARASALLFVIVAVGSGFAWFKTESVPLLVTTIAGGIGAFWLDDHFFFRPWVLKEISHLQEIACQERGHPPIPPEFLEQITVNVRRMREQALVRLVSTLAGALLGYLTFSVGALIFSENLGDLWWWVLGGGILGTLVAPFIFLVVSADNPDS